MQFLSLNVSPMAIFTEMCLLLEIVEEHVVSIKMQLLYAKNSEENDIHNT
jgi:hypothetical protein